MSLDRIIGMYKLFEFYFLCSTSFTYSFSIGVRKGDLADINAMIDFLE